MRAATMGNRFTRSGILASDSGWSAKNKQKGRFPEGRGGVGRKSMKARRHEGQPFHQARLFGKRLRLARKKKTGPFESYFADLEEILEVGVITLVSFGVNDDRKITPRL